MNPIPEQALKPLGETAGRFIEGVLSLRPAIAVFDCDGTLWPNNSGEDFFYWSMEPQRGLIAPDLAAFERKRYHDYRQGKVGEVEMCGEMTAMYQGNSVAALQEAARIFFAEVVAPNIFPDMLEMTRRLAAHGCELWAVSSTNEWVIGEGIREFRIPAEHILAACVTRENGVASGDLVRVPSGEGKVEVIREVIGRPVDAVFGNSIHDAAMLKIAKHAFAVNPNPDLKRMADERGWPMYWPEAANRKRPE